jgi:hypothetical protein
MGVLEEEDHVLWRAACGRSLNIEALSLLRPGKRAMGIWTLVV